MFEGLSTAPTARRRPRIQARPYHGRTGFLVTYRPDGGYIQRVFCNTRAQAEAVSPALVARDSAKVDAILLGYGGHVSA
jgi:hypothetical protein